jgi:hypothetical protein
MPDPAESRQAIPLYQVLVEEFNHQHPDSPISPEAISGKRAAYAAEYDGEHRNGQARTPEELEERRQAIDYRLVREFYCQLHQHRVAGESVDRSALCFSGGGIRSATFGLGILQRLAHLGLATKFNYLSTVSGGGYLGSWLSAWMEREAGGPAAVEAELSRPPRFPLSPEPQPVSHLRSYSRYISPRFGLLSADTWTLVAIFFRNLFLNWLVLLPLLAVALMIPRISIYLARQQHPPAWVPPSVFGLGLLCGIGAIAYLGIQRPSLEGKPAFLRWPDKWRGQGAFLWFCLLPLTAMAIATSLYWAWVPIPLERLSFDVLGLHIPPQKAALAFVGFGLVLHGGGYLVARLFVPLPKREILGVIVTGGLGGYAAWLAASRLFPLLCGEANVLRYVCFAAPLLLFLFLASATLFVGLSSKYTEDEDREWLARAAAWILIFVVVRSTVSLIVIYGPVVWHVVGVKSMSAVGGISGLLTLLLGLSSKTGASESKKNEPAPPSTQVANLAISLAAPLFALSVVVGLAFGTTLVIRLLAPALRPGFAWPLDDLNPDDPHGHLITLYHSSGWVILAVTLGLAALGWIMGFYVDINRFSLHAAYRDRLIRAYLGASRNHDERHPNPFTGFDPADNLQMQDLRKIERPFHVINAALNLVGGKNLAWQDRKAESFTFSALHSGSFCTGYRPSDRYGLHRDKKKAISLGTALAISGAAASPNMGYHSSPVITFILALFNVRLGWWLGNPGPAGAKTYDKSGPSFAPRALLAEAFGLTDDEHPYVYLSDGGHFENLGLYEMVLRRCRYIVVSDGGGDPEFNFEDLGNALSKIRVDLGISIEFDQLPMRSRGDLAGTSFDRTPGKREFAYCALARIPYSCVDYLKTPGDLGDIDGCLLYVKPSLNGTEPADVFHYAKLHPGFPHESTGDQLYSESQFESYRELGYHVMESVGGTDALADLPALFEQAAGYAGGKNPCQRSEAGEKGTVEEDFTA